VQKGFIDDTKLDTPSFVKTEPATAFMPLPKGVRKARSQQKPMEIVYEEQPKKESSELDDADLSSLEGSNKLGDIIKMREHINPFPDASFNNLAAIEADFGTTILNESNQIANELRNQVERESPSFRNKNKFLVKKDSFISFAEESPRKPKLQEEEPQIDAPRFSTLNTVRQ
jgi:hypothetical protein